MRYASEVYLAPKEYTDLIKPYAPGDSLKFRDGRGKLEYFVVEKLDSDIVYQVVFHATGVGKTSGLIAGC